MYVYGCVSVADMIVRLLSCGIVFRNIMEKTYV